MPRHNPDGAASPARRFATVQEAAEIYHIDHKTIRRWIASGLIHGYRVGDRLVRVDLNEVEARAVQVIPAAAPRKPAPARTGR